MKLFKTPENYKDMLDTIGWYTLSFLILYMLIIRGNSSRIDLFLTKYEPTFTIPLLGVDFKFFTAFIPIFLAIFSRSIKLHDKLSNLFGIRERFDVNHVLKNFIKRLEVEDVTDDILKSKRKFLMGKIFYEYTSSSEEKNKIDKHHIEMALDQWTWFWIVLEANFYLIFVIVFFLFVNMNYAFTFFATMLISFLYLFFSYKESIKNADSQIGAILSNPENKKNIKEVINEISNKG